MSTQFHRAMQPRALSHGVEGQHAVSKSTSTTTNVGKPKRTGPCRLVIFAIRGISVSVACVTKCRKDSSVKKTFQHRVLLLEEDIPCNSHAISTKRNQENYTPVDFINIHSVLSRFCLKISNYEFAELSFLH